MSSIVTDHGIRIHPIQTGTVAIKELQRNGQGRNRRSFLRVFADRQWTEPLPILTWLIEHPEGPILIDTGETSRISEPGYFTSWHPYFRFAVREWVAPEDTIASKLRELRFGPEDLRWVVLSHFHTDHAGGLPDVAVSEVVTSTKDYEYSRGLLGKARGMLPQHWPDDFRPTLVDHSDGPFGPFASSTTLTSAGDVHLLPTPGHTPGHLSVALEDGDTVYFFAADASYTERLMLDGVVDGVAPDPAQSRETLARIRELGAQRPTVYLPTHDPDSVARLAARQTVGGAHRPVTT
jgi:glyoxylase-like metal-dependent hydrolase (beta-lactamase superfamily II)